jgi:hypothetical protein
MVYIQQVSLINSIRMKMNFLNLFLKSKINKSKKKKQKRLQRILLKILINKEKYGKIINRFIWILIF